ncbi:MAG: hypothetical protein E7048_00515 [Lentisphaerae bacterium]|nr:hypothetical protein [Lentisphaerota bacterium]
MKKIYILCSLLVSFSFSAMLSAVDIKTPFMTAKLSPKGAMLTALTVKGTAWNVTLQKWGSFTDRITQNISEKTQGLADTAELSFNIKKYTVSKAGTTVTFSGCIGVLPGVVMEKEYFFPNTKPAIRITYRFTNTGNAPVPLGLYTRLFFRTGTDKYQYFQPGAKDIKKIMPGETSLPIKLPGKTFLAVTDGSNRGFLLKLPADDTAGLLNWLIPGGYTQEYLSSQQPIAPGKSRMIDIECIYSENIASAMNSPALTAKKLAGTLPVQVDRMTGIKRKAGLLFFRSIPAPQGSFIDLSFVRQFQDSWRAVELPADKEKSPLAIYSLENGVPNKVTPLEFTRRGRHLIIKVPGIVDKNVVHVDRCKKEGEFIHNISGKTWYGPVTMKCRIYFDAQGGKEAAAADIPLAGALIRNGNMEQADSRNAKRPRYMPFAANPWYQAELQKESSGNTFLRIGKNGFFNFLPEYRKEYTLSLKVRSIGGGGLSRIFVQFYDKNGQYLQRRRLLVLGTKNAFDWKTLERRFYVPDNVAFMRILFLNGQAKGQYLDIDDLQLTLPVETRKSRSRKTVLRDEMTKLWTIPLDLLETISHDLVTPHKKWFKPAAHPVKDVLFISGVGNRITEGNRRVIVELAQRIDLSYTHIPLIPKIKNVVKAYSVYPTHFYPQVSEYTMECLKEIKKLPKVVCFTGVYFNRLQDKNFIDFMAKWQKKGVNFYFYLCSHPPKALLGKEIKPDISPLLPIMSTGPGLKAGSYRFHKNGNSLTIVCSRAQTKSSLVPDNLRFFAKYGYTLPYGFEYPWWEYDYLLELQLLRRLSGIQSPAGLTAAPGGFAVKAARDFSGSVEVNVYTMLRQHLVHKKFPVNLTAGKQVIFPDNFELPGGTFVADLRLLDSKGKVVDAGAIKLFRKEITPLTITLKNKDRIFPHPGKVEFTVDAPGMPQGAKIAVELFNQRAEILFKPEKVAKKQISFSVSLPHLRTFFNYIRAAVIKDGKLLALTTTEFSVPGIPKEMNEFYGFTNPGQSGGAPIKNLEFDFSITGDPRWTHTPGSVRRIRTMGLIPIPRRGDEKVFRPYRDDVKSAPVRTPCFSSPEFHAQLKKDTKFMAENCNFLYNDVNLLWAGDEMFLGRSVCTSPSCLAGFRNELKKSFGTIEALNKNWGSSFKSFADVVPSQLEELKNKNRLGPWLDHKMYMTKVFAENFFGKAREELGKYVPNVKIGPTGTQKPGFGYNWHELMKYCRIAGYYSGVQTKVIHDLSDATLMAGQCGGGYTHGHPDYEVYNYNTMWTTLLNGGNLAYHYAGCAYRGDGAPTRNMIFYTNSLRELKSGIGKLYLSAQPRHEVAILYSQPSLFAAMGSCGQDEWQNSQTSWAKLLDDLRVSARFINYEELAQKGVPSGIRAVVLPFSIALSDQEIANLAKFAAKGGTVIADRNAGIFDAHGRKRSAQELEKLKFITSLNFSLARYNFVQLGGTGGELSASGSGDAEFIKQCRTKVGTLLAQKKITPFVVLTDAKGNEFGCTAKFRIDGSTRVYGFHMEPAELKPALFKTSPQTKVRVKLPRKGHVYDVRSKRYLGLTRSFAMRLVPGWSMIYAVLPFKPESLEVSAPVKVSRGETFKVRFVLMPSKDKQVFRITLHSADGKELKQYSQNLRKSGRPAVEIFIPHNFPKGQYAVKVVHIATGITGKQNFEVK